MKNSAWKAFAIWGTLGAAGFGLIACSAQGGVASGSKAPAFSAQGTDGKTYSLQSLSASGAAILYFIKEGCPVNHQAAPFLAKLSNAYENKASLFGVYNGTLANAKDWAKRYGAKFTILADPDLKIIRGYGVPYSPFLVEVGPGGKVGKLVGDGNPKNLAVANRILASGLGKQLVELSFSGAPEGGG